MQVPESWAARLRGPASELKGWLQALLDHVQTLSQWASRSPATVADLSAFMRPAALLTAVLQVSRAPDRHECCNNQLAQLH